MKNRFLLLLIVLFFFSCRQDYQPTAPLPPDENILLYTSFEIRGRPSLLGWSSLTDYGIRFSHDAPPEGGNWSIELNADWTPAEFAPRILAKIPALPGEHIYRLTFWGKAGPLPGAAFTMLINADTSAIRKRLQIEPTVWTRFTLLDTLNAQPGDSIGVMFSGGFSQVILSSTKYDLCSLEYLN